MALRSRKQKLRKQGRGSSRKGYVLNVSRGSWRCGHGSIAEAVAEAVNNFLSTTKEKRTKLNCWDHFSEVDRLADLTSISFLGWYSLLLLGCSNFLQQLMQN